jgi:hypothetical protein
VFESREEIDAGGLMAYGPNWVDGEFWYSPDVSYIVRYRFGNSLRELTKFTRQP